MSSFATNPDLAKKNRIYENFLDISCVVGYTGHEHLYTVGLVHMNGRIYDPVLRRFLSPDNFVQDNTNTQSYNCYGYVLNNPLFYTDPSGEIIPFVSAVVIGYTSGTKAMMIVGGGLSGGISSSIAGGDFWKGMQQRLITSGLNHAMHGATSGWDQDPPSKESSSSDSLWDKIVSAWADFTGGSEATRIDSEAMALSTSSTGGVDWAGYAAYTLMMEKTSNPGNLEMGRGLFDRTSVGKTSVGFKSFKSFGAFKRAYGAAGKDMAWHHIVEQTSSNVAKFGPEALHNTKNLIKIAHGKGSLHAKILGHYSSKQPFTGGKTVREWLSTQSYKEQYDYGIKIYKQFGGK